MDEQAQATTEIPKWFWVAAGAALLFEVLGCYFYLDEVTMSDAQIAALPIDLGAALAARPSWYYAAFGVAVWVGLAGTALLLMRRRQAVLLLLVSLLAVVVQFSSVVLVPQLRETVPDTALAGPIGIIVICYLIFQLARLAGKRGWLR